MIIGLAIPYHSEQVDPGIALIVDDRPVEGGDVIETFTIYRGEGMSYLEEIVLRVFRDDVNCSRNRIGSEERGTSAS